MSTLSRRVVLGSSLACLLGESACSGSSVNGAEPVLEPREKESKATLPAPVAPDDAAVVAVDDSPLTQTETDSKPSLVCERVVTVVARNHGHELLVAEADILAQEERTYRVRGTSTHDHLLIVTAEEFTLVGQGQVLRKKTELGAGHRHRILIRCEPRVLPPDLVSACDAVIAGEDGHEVVIPESHVRGGVDRKYDIQGVSGHTHTLEIRASDFSRLLAGEQLDLITSQGAAHFHHAYIKYVSKG